MASKKKEPEEDKLPKRQAIKALMNKLNREAKQEVIRVADDVASTYHLRRPCGIMQLDIDTGGGLPAGAFSTVGGPNQAGKSLLLYKYFAMHQRLYGRESAVALAISEGGLDYFAARKAGWLIAVPDDAIEAEQQVRKFRGAPALTKEQVQHLKLQVGENLLIYGETAEEFLDRLYEVIKSNLFGIVALDSLEGLVPSAEAELDTLEDNPQQAARASIVTRFMARYGPLSTGINGPNWTTFIATCQVRSNRKKTEVQSHIARYLPDAVETVPNAVKHWRKINVTVQSGEKIKEGSGENKIQTGKYLKWEITKGTLGTHDGIRGETELIYEQPGLTNDLRDLITCGLKYGVVVERDGLLTFMRASGPDKLLQEVPDTATMMSELQKDFELELALRQEILAAAGKSCLYR